VRVVTRSGAVLPQTRVVQNMFGSSVLTVEGNHYAHLGNLDHPEWGPMTGPVPEGSPRDLIWDRVRAMSARPLHGRSGGGAPVDVR